MAEQAIQVIYRTGEANNTYRTAYNITFFSGTAVLQGVSGTVTMQCWRELMCYFILKGIKQYQYERKKHGKVIKVTKPVRGF
jgi:type III secretory pathway component EscU